MVTERRAGTLVYRPHQLSPQDFLRFVELDEFSDDWKGLGLDIENHLWGLQTCIMSNPKFAQVIEGTGGLRKGRFVPPGWNRGKSGGVRVCYAYFEEHWLVLLVMAYDKREKETIEAEEKAGIKRYLENVKKWLDKRNY